MKMKQEKKRVFVCFFCFSGLTTNKDLKNHLLVAGITKKIGSL
jgi:hypothetical protein